MMGIRNDNVSKDGVKDVYRKLIFQFENENRNSAPLKKRLGELNAKDKKKDKLITSMELLRDVIKDVEDFQDIHGISNSLYYTIKEFLDE